MTALDDLEAVERSIRRRFRVAETEVRVGTHLLSILHPASAEDLIDERDFEQDERLPYWAELWPSARVLAERMLKSRAKGRSLLELGCGSGLVSTSASLAGFNVVASDYYEDALRFARVNARRNGATDIRGILLDWRRMPSSIERFDVVIASDVLYERPYGALIAQVLGATMNPNGKAILADPGRVGRDEFIRALGANGLRVAKREAVAFRDGQIRQTITLFEISRALGDRR